MREVSKFLKVENEVYDSKEEFNSKSFGSLSKKCNSEAISEGNTIDEKLTMRMRGRSHKFPQCQEWSCLCVRKVNYTSSFAISLHTHIKYQCTEFNLMGQTNTYATEKCLKLTFGDHYPLLGSTDTKQNTLQLIMSLLNTQR